MTGNAFGETASTTAVRSATVADAAAVAGIYNHYINETVVTFEEESSPPLLPPPRPSRTSLAFRRR